MSDDRDAFGYRGDDRVIDAAGFQVAEGKRPGTLQPVVVLYVRATLDAEQIGFALAPDQADWLAAQLTQWAQRARDKHFE
jgi:hypothetical protein